ncbi:hypothetical protein CDAR_416221 [Caerostris darwini]|uniref:Uncharacterized protein n=1 Tax=Caerostris darwini TaxID=1538125 RepID=A0AAV4W597_9ARAC|nr:hypothetical protein CDAR_416221 [Caerostris darwini]
MERNNDLSPIPTKQMRQLEKYLSKCPSKGESNIPLPPVRTPRNRLSTAPPMPRIFQSSDDFEEGGGQSAHMWIPADPPSRPLSTCHRWISSEPIMNYWEERMKMMKTNKLPLSAPTSLQTISKTPNLHQIKNPNWSFHFILHSTRKPYRPNSAVPC